MRDSLLVGLVPQLVFVIEQPNGKNILNTDLTLNTSFDATCLPITLSQGQRSSWQVQQNNGCGVIASNNG